MTDEVLQVPKTETNTVEYQYNEILGASEINLL